MARCTTNCEGQAWGLTSQHHILASRILFVAEIFGYQYFYNDIGQARQKYKIHSRKRKGKKYNPRNQHAGRQCHLTRK